MPKAALWLRAKSYIIFKSRYTFSLQKRDLRARFLL